jgi:hypothetical protein
MPQVCDPPALIVVKRKSPDTATGVVEQGTPPQDSTPGDTPSRPSGFDPQHHADPSAVSPQVCALPADNMRNANPPATGVGVAPPASAPLPNWPAASPPQQ